MLFPLLFYLKLYKHYRAAVIFSYLPPVCECNHNKSEFLNSSCQSEEFHYRLASDQGFVTQPVAGPGVSTGHWSCPRLFGYQGQSGIRD